MPALSTPPAIATPCGPSSLSPAMPARRTSAAGGPGAGLLLETLAMSIAGTVLAGLAALVLGGLAARNVAPIGVSRATQFVLNTIRAIPDLIWGVLFVAAVGFGPLPGILALACHSTGMLGKFFAEILEHIDPAPGDALRSQGVSPLGVLRFAIWPADSPAAGRCHRLSLGAQSARRHRSRGHRRRRHRPRTDHRLPPVRISRSPGADHRDAGTGQRDQWRWRLDASAIPRLNGRRAL